MTNTIYIHQPEKAVSFTRLPNFLFEAPTFMPLSNEAKVLYAFILRRTDLSRKNVTTSMDQLIEAAMNQNFVPVVDDRGIFIGIVRRQAIIRYCYEKARTEQQAHEQRIPEYAAVH